VTKKIKINTKLYTLVTPVKSNHGSFFRAIVQGHELMAWIERNINGDNVRFYVEPHDGKQTPEFLNNWPAGFYQ